MNAFSPTYAPTIKAEDLRKATGPKPKPNAFDLAYTPMRANVRYSQSVTTNHKLAKSSSL